MPTRFTCVICKKGVDQVGALYRVNETGQDPLWVCRPHRSQTDAPVDRDVDELLDVIQGRGRRAD